MIKPFDFYFDFVSPYSFLAHKEIRKIEQKNALPETDNLLKSTEYKLIGDVLPNGQRIVDGIATITPPKIDTDTTVSYTHLTLPTIYSV